MNELLKILIQRATDHPELISKIHFNHSYNDMGEIISSIITSIEFNDNNKLVSDTREK